MAAKKTRPDDFEFKFNIIKGIRHVSITDIAKKHGFCRKTIQRAINRGDLQDILWHGNRLVNYDSYLEWEASGLQEGKLG